MTNTEKRGNDCTVLSARAVTRSFSTRRGDVVRALGPIDLTVDAGEFVAIVGPSGCGKTTLLRVLGGLASATSGEVEYHGARVDGPVEDLGIVFQQPVLLAWRSVLRNVTLQLEMRKLWRPAERRTEALRLLASVGLVGLADRYPWELSGGQQQRVSLCRALIHKPGILLMDEPFGALDAITREQLQADLERLWMTEQSTVLFVTHDVLEAVTLADRVIVMSETPGRVMGVVQVVVDRPRGGGVLDHEELQSYAREVRALLGPAFSSTINVPRD